MYPGHYGTFHLSGGSASCAFLNGGVYTWTNGYQSDANGSLLSNELKAPDEQLATAPGRTNVANPQFWDMNGTNCAGHFTVTNSAVGQTVLLLPTCTDLSPVAPANCHSGVSDTQSRNNKWGVEVTSVRYDRFLDSTISSACLAAPGCRRESAPSECKLTPNAVVGGLHSPSNIGISVNITQNVPGAQYYNVYLNPAGCDGNQQNFGWVGRYDAPGFVNGSPVGPYPSGAPWTLGAAAPGVPPVAGATVYDINDRLIPNPSTTCFAQTRSINCAPPDDEVPAQCFSNCPPPANLLSQENAPMSLQYPPYTGGDVANENYCQISPNPGNPIAGFANVTTIFHRLNEKGVKWAQYFFDVPFNGLYSDLRTSNPDSFRPIEALLVDAATGNLPSYVQIDPPYLLADDHPSKHVQLGQFVIAAVYNILSRSPVWEKTALFVNYDEDGGCDGNGNSAQ